MIIDIPLGTSVEVLRDAARAVGVAVNIGDTREVNTRGHGKRVRVEGVLLRPDRAGDPERYRAYSRDRKSNAVCWHGHRDWMREVFKVAPETVVRSALATWDGAEDFEQRHEDSQYGGNAFQSTGNCLCDGQEGGGGSPSTTVGVW